MSASKADRESIIAKIKKLLEHTEAHGATKAEAVAFALKAQKLMAEHDIQEHELGGGENEPLETASSQVKTTRLWRDQLATIIADNFRCRYYTSLFADEDYARRRTAHIRFYGYRHDAQAAALVFDRLYEVGEKLARKYLKDERRKLGSGLQLDTRFIRDSFTFAFVDGVRSELEKQSQALMLVRPKEVDEGYNELSRGFRKARRTTLRIGEAGASEAGFHAGRDAVRSGRLDEGSQTLLTA